jgi:hydrogenase expression/formation protein HypC
MCLGIAGEVIELMAGHEDLAMVDVEGVKRAVNIGLLHEEGVAPGDWIIVHLGFAFSKVDEAQAKASLDFVTGRDGAFAED